MTFDDFGTSDPLKRLIESMRAQSHMLDQLKSTQRTIDALSASSGIKEKWFLKTGQGTEW
jgi:hypothetical protein